MEIDRFYGFAAHRAMDRYMQWLPPAERAFMLLSAFFDRPVSIDAFIALIMARRTRWLCHVLLGHTPSDLSYLINTLREAALVLPASHDMPDMIDFHPVVRQYCIEELETKPIIRRRGNAVLFEYVSSTIHEKRLDSAEILLGIVFGCRAERYKLAFCDLYIPMRPALISGIQQPGSGPVLHALGHFFEDGDWKRPVATLSQREHQLLLMDVAHHLTCLNGYAATGLDKCYSRALECCDNEQDDYRISIEYGLCRFHRMRGNIEESGRLARNVLQYGRDSVRRDVEIGGHRALSAFHFYKGEIHDSLYHAQALTKYDDDKVWQQSTLGFINNPHVMGYGYCALCLWLIGKTEESSKYASKMQQIAESSGDRHSAAMSSFILCMLYQFANERNRLARCADELMTVCSSAALLQWRAAAEMLQGYAAIGSKDQVVARDLLESGIRAWRSLEARLFLPYWYSMLALCCHNDGNIELAEKYTKCGLRSAKVTGEVWWNAELYFLLTTIHTTQGHYPEAKSALERAYQIAASQGTLGIRQRWVKDVEQTTIEVEIGNTSADKQAIP